MAKGDDALAPKTKSLIALAVAAQIPCDCCIYADTLGAKRAGATDEEIAEAAGLSWRHRGTSGTLAHILKLSRIHAINRHEDDYLHGQGIKDV